MSRVRTDRIEGINFPLPEVAGLTKRETIIVTAASQAVFTLTKFAQGAKLKAFNGTTPVTVTWTGTTQVTISPTATSGDKVHFYADTEDLAARMDEGEAAIANLNSTAVKRTSSTGAAQIPAGTNAQRPSGAAGHIRLNTEEGYYEGFVNGEWKPLGADSVPMFASVWFPSRAVIAAGYVAQDGQVLSRATYPKAWEAINAETVPVVEDSVWLADPLQRGKFTRGNGSSTFRIPDLNGKQAGSVGAVFMRGDGTLSAGTAGVIQQDAMQGHMHGTSHSVWVSTSIINIGAPGGEYNAGLTSTAVGSPTSDGVNGTPRTDSETRPLNVTGVWAVKLFGAVTNTGSANAAQLASDYANLAGRVSVLEGKPAVGWSQTYQSLLASRALGTTYTNTTGKPIEVHVAVNFTASTYSYVRVDGTVINQFGGSGNLADMCHSVSFTVPAGATYSVDNATGASVVQWVELR